MVGEKGPDPGKLSQKIQDRVAAKLNPTPDQPVADSPLKMEDVVRAKAAENKSIIDKDKKAIRPDRRMVDKAMKRVAPPPEPVVPDKTAEPTPEPVGEKLAKLKRDLEEKRKKYASEDADQTGTLKRIARTLGIPISEKKGEDVELAEKDYYDALWKYVDAEKENMPAGDKEVARALLKQIYLGEAVTIRSLKEDKMNEMKKGKNELANKCVDGYKHAVDWWRGLSLKKKLAYSGAMFGIGLAGGTSITMVASSMFAMKFATRLLGAGSMYIGAKKWQETRFAKKAEDWVNQAIEEMLSRDNWENEIRNLNLKKEELRGYTTGGKEWMEQENLKHQRRALVLALALPAIGSAIDIYKMSFGGGGGKNILEEAKDSPDTGAKVPESAKGILGTPPVEDAPKPSIAEAKLDTDARYGPGKYGPMGYGTEIEGHAPEASELRSDTIEKGGGLWKSTERLIRANPDKFKLDPNSKTFVRDARRMTKDLLDKFAEKNGIGYEDLDEIARKKVRPGDILKIIQDPSTGKPSIDYSRDEIFGQGGVPKAGVSSVVEQGTAPKGAGAEEYVPKKPDWMKPYDENIAQAKKNFDYYNLESKTAHEALRDAQENFLEANTAEAHIKYCISSRGIIDSILQKAGVSTSRFWEDQASKIYIDMKTMQNFVAADVLEADKVSEFNQNREIIRKVFKELGPPKSYQTTWEYLREALEDTNRMKAFSDLIL